MTATLYPPVRALLRDELGELTAYVPHPGDYEVRLDANEAPDLWSIAARERLGRAAVEVSPSRYPDATCTLLREAIAARVGARREELIVGCGSDEVIALLLTAFDRPRPRGRASIVVPSPTFVMYAVSARARGFQVVQVPLDAEWQLSVPSIRKAVEAATPSVLFLASPNNPTGASFRTADLRALIEASPSTLVVLDEAYVAYADGDLRALYEAYPNVALLGTLSKIGLASLRIGWLRGHPELVRELDKVRQPYNVPAVTQQMATVALTELGGEIDRTIAVVRVERERVAQGLTGHGWAVTPSDANFVWARTPRPAGEVFDALRARGVLVRSFHERGGRLGSQVRVTIGAPHENDRLLAAVAEIE
jgi:histidinol-phosphate aminotransferase